MTHLLSVHAAMVVCRLLIIWAPCIDVPMPPLGWTERGGALAPWDLTTSSHVLGPNHVNKASITIAEVGRYVVRGFPGPAVPHSAGGATL